MVTSSSSFAAAQPADVPRVMHAAREFEAVLLNTLLGPLEHSFSSLPGGDHTSESDHYRSLGVQALAENLAQCDGLGIADLIVRNLLKTQGAEKSGGQKIYV